MKVRDRLLESKSAPINTLPVEILAEILLFVQAYVFDYPPEKYGTACHWINVSWVCAHWRTIVVSNSSFWRTIVVRCGPELLSLALERTIRGLPVAILFEDASFPWSSLQSILQDRADDVRTVRFERADKKFQRSFPSIFSDCPMPALEELAVFSCELTCAALPLNQNDFPALRSLSLFRLDCLANNTLLSRLRRLKMHDSGWEVEFGVFLDMLQACTQLEELDLEFALPQVEDFPADEILRVADGSRRPTVSLPRVRTVRFDRHPPDWTVTVLPYLCFPNATDITVISDVRSPMRCTDDPVNIASMFPKDPTETFPVFKTVTSVVVDVYNNVYEMCMQSPQGATVLLSADDGGALWLEADAACAVLAVPSICRGAPITSLRFRGEFTILPDELSGPSIASIDPDAQRWVTIFMAFGSLNTLHLTTGGLCRAMWEGLWAATNTSGDQCCPSLRSIILDQEIVNGWECYSDDALEDDFASMWKALILREQLGLHLHALTLKVGEYNDTFGLADQRDIYFDKLKSLVTNLVFPTHTVRVHEYDADEMED